MKKVIIAMLCSVAVVGFVVYEVRSIIVKEHLRQTDLMLEAREGINFGFDMAKIGVLTDDVEVYGDSLAKVKEGILKIEPLFLVEKDEFLAEVGDYVGMLEEKANLLVELKNLKESIVKLKDEFGSKYGNKDEISRDKVKAAKDEIVGLKIDISSYSEEKIIAMVNTINNVLDEVSNKVGTLADCIDNCYRNRIGEINNELADIFKGFSNKASELNLDFEKEFDFGRMAELKMMYNEEEEPNEEEEQNKEEESNEEV